MAAITDLTWEQLKAAMVTNGIDATAIAVVGGKVLIDAGLVIGSTADALTDAGVVKFVGKILENAAKAQTTANEGQTAGERLSAIGAQVTGTPAAGFVPVTRSVNLRYELSSVANIVGSIA